MRECRATDKLRRLAALAMAAACLAPFAAGAYTCSVPSATPVTATYEPTSAIANVTVGSWTFTCTRQAGDPGGGGGFGWQLGADNGVHSASGQSYVLGPANGTINYELYQTYPSPLWGQTAGTFLTGSLNFGGVGTPAATRTASGSFDLAVPAGQSPWPAAGTYTDTVTVTLQKTSAGGVFPIPPPSTTFNVTVVVPTTCQISVPPGNVDFAYTSLQAAPSAANTTYGVRCTSATPYTMSLDPSPGPLLGLNYTLSLPVTSGTGTGLTQTYTIDGSIAGGQAGTCATASCSGSQLRTLTVSY
jgi:spore coat protein U-like protein